MSRHPCRLIELFTDCRSTLLALRPPLSRPPDQAFKVMPARSGMRRLLRAPAEIRFLMPAADLHGVSLLLPLVARMDNVIARRQLDQHERAVRRRLEDTAVRARDIDMNIRQIIGCRTRKQEFERPARCVRAQGTG